MTNSAEPEAFEQSPEFSEASSSEGDVPELVRLGRSLVVSQDGSEKSLAKAEYVLLAASKLSSDKNDAESRSRVRFPSIAA